LTEKLTEPTKRQFVKHAGFSSERAEWNIGYGGWAF
jgi:hypothetical protein